MAGLFVSLFVSCKFVRGGKVEDPEILALAKWEMEQVKGKLKFQSQGKDQIQNRVQLLETLFKKKEKKSKMKEKTSGTLNSPLKFFQMAQCLRVKRMRISLSSNHLYLSLEREACLEKNWGSCYLDNQPDWNHINIKLVKLLSELYFKKR